MHAPFLIACFSILVFWAKVDLELKYLAIKKDQGYDTLIS